MCFGLFADGSYGQGWNGVGATEYLGTTGAALKGVTGLFYGDSKQLIAQFVEVGTGAVWNLVLGGVIFWAIGKVLGNKNRVSKEVEIAGLDVPEMGVPGYPEFLPPEPVTEVPGGTGSAKKSEDAQPVMSDKPILAG